MRSHLALGAMLLALVTTGGRAEAQAGSNPEAAPATARPATAKPATEQPAAPKPQLRSELPVLGLSTDDADDQAEGLTGAIRSRVRSTPGLTLDETAVNLGTYLSALNCGPRPDPSCLLKIGDQLKVSRFIWGNVRKGPERGQVTAEVHLWRRGKADAVATESYSDNVRDQNDDVLRRIAGRMVDRLLGQAVAAPVIIRIGDRGGEIVIDGAERAPIVRGEATVELKPGRHVLEVRADGLPPEKHEVEVTSTAEQVLSIRLGEQKVEPPSKPISGRTFVALGLLGVGAGFGVAAIVKGAQFLSLQEENKRDHESLAAEDFCDASKPNGADVNALDDACQRLEQARDARLLGFVFGGIAAASVGTGIVLLLTDPERGDAKESPKAASTRRSFRLAPRVGRSSAGVDLSLRF